MQGICTHIPETNYVPRECSVAAILLLLFMVLLSLHSVLNLLYFYISTFGSICAVPNMAVSVVPVLLFYYYYYYYYPTMWASTASSRRTNFTKALCPSSKESLSLKKNLRNFNTNNIIFQYLTFELDTQTFKTISSEFISHLPVTVLSELHLHVLFNSLFARNVRFRPPVSLSPILCLCVYSLI